MIKNYLFTTIRNFLRSRVFSMINIFGLAIGIACVVLFFLWVKDEISYDRFHENRSRIYNLLSVFDVESSNSMSVTPFPLAPALEEKYPEVELYSRYWNFTSLVSYEENNYVNEKIFLVDPGFLQMFSFPLISGNPEKVLLNRSSVVITESEAARYFGNENPVGKILTFNMDLKLTVTGVVKDPPKNSIFDFSMLASIQHVPESRLYNDWTYAGPAYIMLAKGSSASDLQEKIRGFYSTINPDTQVKLVLQHFKEVYLYRDGIANRIIYVYLFSGIAVLILILACINYMNLSTAQSLKRSKEIGLRKANGAGRRQIIIQFMGESMLYAFFSIIIAMIIVELVRPLFNTLTAKQLEIHYGDPIFISGIIIIYLFTSVASGLYPAFVLSSFRPIQIINGLSVSNKSKRILNSLVIFQLTISLALIISSMTINRQVNYIQKKDLGINKERVILLPFGLDLIQHYDLMREKIMSHPNVVNVSASYDLPFLLNSAVSFTWDDVPGEEAIPVRYNMVDYDFIETMEIEMLEGRTFSREYASDDSIAYIINESAFRRMGVDNATGLSINFMHPHLPEYLRKGTIIGVVKDFNIRPLREEIVPLVLKIYRPFYQHLYIRYNTDDPGVLIAHLQQLQSDLYPGIPFNYSFLEEEVDKIYSVEYRTGKIIRYFTFISILISCLGLLGMAIYDLEIRTREIAIRKVMASSISQIITMILAKYFRWILLSFLIASPIAYIMVNKWVQGFAYGVKVSPFTFLISLLLVTLIAFITIGLISLKSARKNPANVLKQN